MKVKVPVSVGELVDKITILDLKKEKITDAEKLAHVVYEYKELEKIFQKITKELSSKQWYDLNKLISTLFEVNRSIWDVEDDLRDLEHKQEFGKRFVELARMPYKLNDQRSTIKGQINKLCNSTIVEAKQYTSY